jgi:hypothetical protein
MKNDGRIMAALVTLLAVAVAAPTASGQQPGGLLRINSQGRKVRVVQGNPRMALLTQPSPEDVAEPIAEGEADDSSWQADWDNAGEGGCPSDGCPSDGCPSDGCPSGGCSTGGCGDGCADGECAGGCDDCDMSCGTVCGETPFWTHRTYLFGEYLYLLPTDADMAHAIQQNGVGGPGTVPAGAVGVLQPDFTSAYRTGFGVAIGCNATIAASYTNFHDHATDSLAAPTGIVGGTVASLVLHPQSLNAGSTSSLVDATYDIHYQLADIEFRRLLSGTCKHAVNYSVGARYGKLEQNFLQIGEFSPPTGTIRTTTDIEFEGVGLRAGLDGEHRIGYSGFAGYGKLSINVLVGEFRTNYLQLDTTTTDVQANSTWNDRRVVPLLDYEVGVSWTSRSGHWRASAGYYTAFWFNTITTGEYVQAVQTADFVDVGETIAFNGLVSRVEFRF